MEQQAARGRAGLLPTATTRARPPRSSSGVVQWRGVAPTATTRAAAARPGETFPNQLYIAPGECIDCGVCEPGCPWEAIFEDGQVPEVFEDDTALNAKMLEYKDEFRVPEVEDMPQPSPEQIAANKEKWGFTG